MQKSRSAIPPPERLATLHALAARLAKAWRDADRIDRLGDDERPRSRAEAYLVQDHMAELLGEPLIGWKLGATSAKMRQLDGHDDVIPGRILGASCHFGTAITLPEARYRCAGTRVEAEFAFRLDADLPLRAQPWHPDELAERVTLYPALEIIGNRYPLDARIDTLAAIADNGGGIGFVFGAALPQWREHDIDFSRQPIALRVDGAAAAENFLGEMRCRPLQALADCAQQLATRGIALAAGQFVSTGAATVPQPIATDHGSEIDADFGPLGRIQLRCKK